MNMIDDNTEVEIVTFVSNIWIFGTCHIKHLHLKTVQDSA